MRIVSLLPSATEIVCALGAREELVGRSAECDYPESVRSLPVVMRAKTLDAAQPSAEIDRRVQEARHREESLYDLDIELLRSLAPGILLTQDLCRVCSVSEDEVAAACRSARVSPSVITLSPVRLADVAASITEVGRAIDRASAGAALAQSFREQTEPTPAGPRPRTLVLDWLDPPLVAGLWVPDMVASAGGEPLLVRPGEPGQRSDWPTLARLRPDLLVVSPCSFSVERAEREIRTASLAHAIERVRPPLGTWMADEAYFSRPGPRLVLGVALLRSLLRGEMPDRSLPVHRWMAPPAPDAR